MKPSWTDLRGEDLSAYAASDKAMYEWDDFAKHLAQYGTARDFGSFVERDPDPLKKCLQVFAAHPAAARQWVERYLNTTQNDPKSRSHTNFTAAQSVCEHAASFGAHEIATAIFQYIDMEAMSPTHKIQLFKPLVQSGMHNVIEQNWIMYKPLIEGLTPQNIDNYVKFSAYFGWNLHERITKPTSYFSNGDLFVACCAGGLLAAAQKVRVPERRYSVIFEAFVATAKPLDKKRAPNFEEVLQYLWNTYPQTPWSINVDVLRAVVYTSGDFAAKIVKHFVKNDPSVLEFQAPALAHKAIATKNIQLFETLAQHIPSERLPGIIQQVILNRQKAMLKVCLALPNGYHAFHSGSAHNTDADQTWAHKIYMSGQRSKLKKSLGHTAQKSSGPSRKM